LFCGCFFYRLLTKVTAYQPATMYCDTMPQYPARGLIYDRNGELLVYNEAAYDLMVVPHQVQNIDTAELCKIIGIDKLTFERNLKRARAHSFLQAFSVRNTDIKGNPCFTLEKGFSSIRDFFSNPYIAKLSHIHSGAYPGIHWRSKPKNY
jgi:cell division protein FtsI/penicillin-binding protein 2